jgi:hypothetical protein
MVRNKGKGKAIPVIGREGPLGYETSRVPHLTVMSALRAGRPLPPGRFLALISVRD